MTEHSAGGNLSHGGDQSCILTQELGGSSQHPLHKRRVNFEHISVEGAEPCLPA